MLHVLATYRASANERYVCAVTVTISFTNPNNIEQADRPNERAAKFQGKSDCPPMDNSIRLSAMGTGLFFVLERAHKPPVRPAVALKQRDLNIKTDA